MKERERIVVETVLSNEESVAALVAAFQEKQQQFKDSFWASNKNDTLVDDVIRIKGVVEGLNVAIALVTSLGKKR